MATDFMPWLQRRLALACAMADELRQAQGRALTEPSQAAEPLAIDNAGLALAPAAPTRPTHE